MNELGQARLNSTQFATVALCAVEHPKLLKLRRKRITKKLEEVSINDLLTANQAGAKVGANAWRLIRGAMAEDCRGKILEALGHMITLWRTCAIQSEFQWPQLASTWEKHLARLNWCTLPTPYKLVVLRTLISRLRAALAQLAPGSVEDSDDWTPCVVGFMAWPCFQKLSIFTPKHFSRVLFLRQWYLRKRPICVYQ